MIGLIAVNLLLAQAGMHLPIFPHRTVLAAHPARLCLARRIIFLYEQMQDLPGADLCIQHYQATPLRRALIGYVLSALAVVAVVIWLSGDVERGCLRRRTGKLFIRQGHLYGLSAQCR